MSKKEKTVTEPVMVDLKEYNKKIRKMVFIIVASLIVGGVIAWFGRGLLDSTINSEVIKQVSQLK